MSTSEELYWRDQADYSDFVEREHDRFESDAAEGEAFRAALDAQESAIK